MENNVPIRVAHIIGKWVGGGVESVVMNYYRNIDRNKIQFDFICDNDSTNIPYEEIYNLGGRVIMISPYQQLFKYLRELTKVLKKEKYKIVHSHINTLSVFSLYAAKRAGVPIRIAHSHSTTNKKESKRNLMKNILRPFSKVFATDYMCCSELAGRWLFGDKMYDKGLVYLLNNAIDTEKFKYNENIRIKKRNELNVNNDTFVIGHVGRFVPQKNHDFLIDIFYELHNQYQNSILILVGQGPLVSNIKKKVKQLNIEDNVMFLGQRNDVNELYQAFDLFLLPSLYEGLGMVLIEAQYNGLSCIASTEVPSIARISDYIEFISLNKDSKYWTDKTLEKLKKNQRKDIIGEITVKGFNIKNEAIKLFNYYEDKLNF